MNKTYITLGAIVVLIFGVVLGYSTHSSTKVGNLTPGVTNSGDRAQSIAMAGIATSTWVSMLNSDTNDRLVTGINMGIQGTFGIGSTSAELLNCSTSTNAFDSNSNTNYLLVLALAPVAGSNVNVISTSSPLGLTGAVASTSNTRIWTAGSYLNCLESSKGLWTSTTTGEFQVNYLPM